MAVVIPAMGDAAGTADRPPLRITFIDNAGFLIFCDGRKILIDAHTFRTPGKVKGLMEKASPPFDAIDLILTTNNHSNHCDPLLIASHLAQMPDTVFVSTTEIVNDTWSLMPFSPVLPPRLKSMEPKKGEMTPIGMEGINLVVLNLSEGRNVTNLGFVIRVSGWTLLHPGRDASVPDLEVYNPADCGIDFAFIPYPFLIGEDHVTKDGRSPMAETIQAKHIVPAGFSGKDAPKGLEKAIAEKYPDCVILRKSMDSRLFSGKKEAPDKKEGN